MKPFDRLVGAMPLDELASHIRWHEWRAWGAGNGQPTPPANVDDPCGGCGRSKSVHPIPSLIVGGSDNDEIVARSLLAAGYGAALSRGVGHQ